MGSMLLKFVLGLEQRDTSLAFLPHGPLFHRWLPDGEKDAISLDSGGPNAEVKVWFERRGFVDSGFIRFDYKRKEVDPAIAPRQGILEGGALFGLLKMKGLSADDMTFFAAPVEGDPRYLNLGKNAIQLIYSPVKRFLDVLRTHFGQYWIARLDEWDSRRMTLGAYCGRLNLKGSIDNGHSWFDFVPDKPVLMSDHLVGGIRFGEYLTRQAWDQLADAAKADFQPSLAADLLVRAHELADNDELRYAFTEGASGLEVAIGEAVRSALGAGEKLQKAANAFWSMPLRARAIILLGLAKTKQADIEAALEGIEIRNEILHKGWMPPKEENARRRLRDVLSGLLRAAASLLQGPKFRFPSAHTGNVLVPDEAAWEVEYKKIGLDA